jgi:hypothetical protein
MFIKPIREAGKSRFQVIVRFPTVPAWASWWQSYHRRMEAAARLPVVASAYRLQVRPNGTIVWLFSAVFDSECEQSVRRLFGSMCFLEHLEEDSVELPGDDAEFKTWCGDFPPLYYGIVPANLCDPTRTAWLACDFRIARHLNELVQDAQLMKYAFAYEAHFRSFEPSIDQQQRIRKNSNKLRHVKNTPAKLIANQERQAERFGSATLLIQEIVATDRDEASQTWLKGALARALKNYAAESRLPTKPVDFTQSGVDPQLLRDSTLLHNDRMVDQVLCSQAAEESFRQNLLFYRPTLLRQSSAVLRDDDRDLLPQGIFAEVPPPYEGPGNFFASYRRKELPIIAPTLRRQFARGVPIWYDRGIQGGEEWDAVIERKIEEARMILFFLSQAAIDSKYCRCEVKFAVAMNKPVLIVCLEEAATLRHGLKLLLQSVQTIPLFDDQFDSRFDSAICNLLNDDSASK